MSHRLLRTRPEPMTTPAARKGCTAETRRGVVIKRIDDWLAKLQGHPRRRTYTLSRMESDGRWVRLMYGNEEVPLTSEGHTVGVLDPKKDEIEFWLEMKAEVAAGRYDEGIRHAYERIVHRLGSARA